MTKTCYTCKEEKPTSVFRTNRATKDGLSFYCKACARKKEKEAKDRVKATNLWAESRGITEESEDKLCRKCGETKPGSEFSRDITLPGGLRSICKICDKTRAKEYFERNREYRLKALRKNKEKKQKISAAMATKSGRWSQDETDMLIELRKTKTVYQCSIEIGRSQSSVTSKIEALRKKGVEI